MKKKNGPKIVMVGGGSYGWSPQLLSDLMQTPEMEGSEIILLDPNRQAAKEVCAAANTMAQTFKRQYTIRPTSNEASAFRGADFVLITISTGALKSMQHDLKIPEKYGIFHTVGDTVGPGGWSRTLRNVPVLAHLARQIEKYAPRAVVLNYTNPMSTLTQTINTVSSLRTVGLCHGAFENYSILQRLFDVEEKDLCVTFGGINHFFWFLDFTVKGRPGYPMLAKKLDKIEAGEVVDIMGFHSHLTLATELYREHGYITYLADRHTCEFLPGYITPKESVLKRFKLRRTSAADRAQGYKGARKRVLAMAAGKVEPPARSRETAVDIMMALAHNKPFCDVVNLPNTGQIDNLPRGASVETLGYIDSLGFRAINVGPLPTVLQQLVEPHCRCQMMSVEAALTGDKEMALQALLIDPLCAHLAPSEVRQMGLELMRATREWLPQFRGKNKIGP